MRLIKQTCFAGHSGVDGIRAEPLAINCIVGIGGRAANDIAGVDISNIDLDIFVFEMLGDFIFQENADICENLIAGGIDGAGIAELNPGQHLRQRGEQRGGD